MPSTKIYEVRTKACTELSAGVLFNPKGAKKRIFSYSQNHLLQKFQPINKTWAKNISQARVRCAVVLLGTG